MRAVLCERQGSLDDLSLREVQVPEIRPGTVLLRVLAAGVNHDDGPSVGGQHAATPFVPGTEFVGTITALADDVARDAPHLEVGARVMALARGGGFAEEVVVPAHSVSLVPDVITDGQAATFARSYLTAVFALRHRGAVERDDVLLVTGAGSGVGLAAVDVAASMHVRVIAAASTDEKRGLARERGADHTLDVDDDDIELEVRELAAAAGKDGVDHVCDPVGGERSTTWLRCLGTGGQYLVVGFVAGAPSLPLDQVLHRNRRVTGVELDGWAARHTTDHAALLHDVMRLIATGRLHPVEPTAYPLDRTVDALRDLAERRASGKLVVIP